MEPTSFDVGDVDVGELVRSFRTDQALLIGVRWWGPESPGSKPAIVQPVLPVVPKRIVIPIIDPGSPPDAAFQRFVIDHLNTGERFMAANVGIVEFVTLTDPGSRHRTET